MLRTLARLLIVLLLLVPAATVSGQADNLMGRPVAEIRVTVEGRWRRDVDVDRVLETRMGAPLSQKDVRESIVHLMAMGRFEDVRVSADALGEGVRLTYDLVPLRSVKDFVFRGDLGLSARQLRRVLTERYTRIPSASRAQEMANALEAFYHGHGYLNAAVDPKVEPSADGKGIVLVFEVRAGPRARVGAATVEGAPGGNADTVLSKLGLQRGSTFDRDELERRITKYLTELQSRGYYNARVEPELAYSENRERVDVAIRMSAGSRVQILFTGDALTEATRAEAERLRQEGTTDEDSLEDSQRRIEDGLRAQGYRDATVTFDRVQRPSGQEQILFTVDRGRQYQVASVEVTGNDQLPLTTIRPNPRLVNGQLFVKSRLDLDIATMTEIYRRQGFRDVKTTWAVSARQGAEAQLDVRIRVTEGPRTTIADIAFEGQTLPEATLRGRVGTKRGDPYYQPAIANDRDSVLLEYLNRGYQQAAVEVRESVSADGREASLRFVVHEGTQTFVDHVLVVGNVRTKTAVIEREISLRPGMPISVMQLAEAQRRLSALGLFRRVEVRTLQHGAETRKDVLVVVEEAPPTTIGYGGGLELLGRLRKQGDNAVTRYEVTPRGFFEIGRRNLWGKNRSVNLFTRVAIRASDQVASSEQTASTPSTPVIAPLDDTSSGFREYRVLGAYREPRVFGTSVDLSVSALADQAIRSSFDFRRSQLLVEGSHRFGPQVSLAGRYTLSRSKIFNARIAQDDQLYVDRLFPQVRLSSFSGTITRDTRNDLIEPSRGTLMLFDGTLAARRLGSEVGFTKGVIQAFAFKRIPALGQTVLAMGVRIGLARAYARYVPDLDDRGEPVLDANRQPVLIKVEDIPASERFFAGGDNTLRGFETDRLGAPTALDRNGVSNGGNALLLWNTELRFPILPNLGLGGVVFADVGNVFLRVGDMDLGQLRTGIGTGIRWGSPVGPLRIDFGWKVRRHTFLNGEREGRFRAYFAIGQAF